jgi:endonuclease/exonuclease/phosphatase family metal-dependent hydrolase
MKLVVASYNVHGFVGTDGARDVRRVGAVVQQLEADVVALQEVAFSGHEPSELLHALPGYEAFAAPIVRDDGVRHGNVLLTRLPIDEARRIALDFKRREPRTAVDARLRTTARPLRVVATHLGLEPGERRFQVRLILQHVASDDGVVTVLLGDFNEWFLVGRPLRWLHARFGRSQYVGTFPSWWPVLALDRVWVQPKSALERCAAFDTTLSRAASDHLPLVAQLDV